MHGLKNLNLNELHKMTTSSFLLLVVGILIESEAGLYFWRTNCATPALPGLVAKSSARFLFI